jgi:hypothetical protein
VLPILVLELLPDSGPRDLYVEDWAVAAEVARYCSNSGDGFELMFFERAWSVSLSAGKDILQMNFGI